GVDHPLLYVHFPPFLNEICFRYLKIWTTSNRKSVNIIDAVTCYSSICLNIMPLPNKSDRLVTDLLQYLDNLHVSPSYWSNHLTSYLTVCQAAGFDIPNNRLPLITIRIKGELLVHRCKEPCAACIVRDDL